MASWRGGWRNNGAIISNKRGMKWRVAAYGKMKSPWRSEIMAAIMASMGISAFRVAAPAKNNGVSIAKIAWHARREKGAYGNQ